jgi:sporulation protein YlmC with PRC-barrel domain
MSKFVYPALILALATTGAYAHHEDADKATPAAMMTTIPGEAWSVTDWYKQSVYDLKDNKVGEIKDVVLDHDGKAAAIIVGAGGFIGIGEKDVAVPYADVHFKKKDNKWYPVMNTTKDALKSAPGFKFERNAMKWMPDGSSAAGGPTVGGPSTPPVKAQ